MWRALALVSTLWLTAGATAAQDLDSVVEADLRPGWRLADGTHMAAVQLRLAPGWKTYWRSPGDAGIPPLFDWRATGGVQGVTVLWPAPTVFFQSGMRSVGYSGDVVLPLRVAVADGAAPVLSATVDLGICREVCIPYQVTLSGTLAPVTTPDARIAAALAALPLSAAEAGLGTARCRLVPVDGGMALRAEIDMPRADRGFETVIETADPNVWVADPATAWQGRTLVAETELRHVTGGAFAVDRSGVRFTLLQNGTAIELQGCSAG